MIKENEIGKIVDALKNNGVIAFKTDTIYGLSCSAYSDEGIDKIFNLKGRENKPLILLVEKDFDISQLVYVNENAKKIIENFWPGKLTIIFKCKAKMNEKLLLNGKISLRCPSSKLCQGILNGLKQPITSTSANLSGQKVLQSPSEIEGVFKGVLVIDSGICENSLPSTIIDASEEEIKLIREGEIKFNDILKVLNN